MERDAAAQVLEVEDLQVSFPSSRGPLPAVDGVRLTVGSAETVALVGESGCGKTMTGLAVLGLTPPEATVSGRIVFEGQDVRALPRRQLRHLRGAGISMVFQEPVSSLNPVFRIGDQINDVIRAHDRSVSKGAARDRAVELLERVGIPDAARRVDEYPHQWSGGMCQRAVIAMAVANRPRLVIADEPTTALDVTVQARVLRVLRDVQAGTGAAVLLITHDLGVVAEMADRVVVMYAGRVVEEAGAIDLYRNPRHPYTRGLLASLPRVDAVGRLTSIPGQPPQLHAVPPGCPFHPRCETSRGRARCVDEIPPLLAAGPGRRSACHFHEELADLPPPEATGPAGDRSPVPAPDDEPILQLDALTVHFPIRSKLFGRVVANVRAVDGVSLELHRGETVGLVGESGCGKSTTAYAIVRLLDPTRGRILFNGQDLGALSGRELRRVRRGIQMVFQDPQASLNPKMTVGSSITEPLAIHGLSRKQATARLHQLLEMVGLDRSHANRYPHQFSGGQLQRVGIARALALEPQVLVLDEPVSALDVSIQAQVLNLLADLRSELGLTYLIISHDLSVVRQVADRVAVMYLGSIVESGPTEAVFDDPQHPYTIALLDAIPVPDPVQAGRGSRIVLTGEVPNPAHPPSGCRFRTRCWRAEQRCADEAPALVDRLVSGQPVACHFPGAHNEEPVKTAVPG
ncbi:MAG: ABC transporter ATP-binding protein [Actinomycetota bacterium]|nr:ABC transporter ATP-binding protein [Actinomycetota bacterium]